MGCRALLALCTQDQAHRQAVLEADGVSVLAAVAENHQDECVDGQCSSAPPIDAAVTRDISPPPLRPSHRSELIDQSICVIYLVCCLGEIAREVAFHAECASVALKAAASWPYNAELQVRARRPAPELGPGWFIFHRLDRLTPHPRSAPQEHVCWLMDVMGRNSERHRQELVREGGVALAMTAMRNHAKQAYVVEWSLKAICTLSADDDDARVRVRGTAPHAGRREAPKRLLDI